MDYNELTQRRRFAEAEHERAVGQMYELHKADGFAPDGTRHNGQRSLRGFLAAAIRHHGRAMKRLARALDRANHPPVADGGLHAPERTAP